MAVPKDKMSGNGDIFSRADGKMSDCDSNPHSEAAGASHNDMWEKPTTQKHTAHHFSTNRNPNHESASSESVQMTNLPKTYFLPLKSITRA
jgi:hypothetical protein